MKWRLWILVASFLLAPPLAAARPQEPATLNVSVSQESSITTHEYSLIPGMEALGLLRQVEVEIRGPKPTAIKTPTGWESKAISPALAALWGCDWRVIWRRQDPADPMTAAQDGFILLFDAPGPPSYCFGRLDFANGGSYSFGGPDSIPQGVAGIDVAAGAVEQRHEAVETR